MKLITLASGSKGNCTFISNETTNILIDCGISYREFERRAEVAGLGGKYSAILITHTHSDHIRGVAQLLQKSDVPIYAHRKMQAELRQKIGIADLQINAFDDVFSIGGIDIFPFATPHDTAQSFGYTLSYNGKRISIATDLGHVSERVFESIKDSDLVLIEANYDEEMLLGGSYPQFLKSRILSKKGHLSNVDCAMLCGDLVKNKTRKIILGHLSENNNEPRIAFSEVKEYLYKQNLLSKVELYIADQYEPSELIEI